MPNHKPIDYNEVFWHITTGYAKMPKCDVCGYPGTESFQFQYIERLYAFDKRIRFDGFESWSGTNKPVNEYTDPKIKTGGWMCISLITRDNKFDKNSVLEWGKFETLEQCVEEYFKTHSSLEKRDWYRKCMKKYMDDVIEARTKNPDDSYYAGVRLDNMFIPEEN